MALHKTWRQLAVGLCCLLGAVQTASSASSAPDCTTVRPLTQAQRTVQTPDMVLDARAVITPDVLQRAWLHEDTRIRYRVALDDCTRHPGQAIWVYRVGAPYQITADGVPLVPIQPVASPQHATYNGRVPALFELPAGARELQLELRTIPYALRGLISVDLAPIAALQAQRSLAVDALTHLNDASSTVILAIGLMALSAWGLRRQDHSLLWLGLACVVWAIRGVAYQTFAMPLDPLAMEQINPLAIMLTCAAIAVSLLHSLKQATPLRLRGLLGLTGVLVLGFAVALGSGQGNLLVRALAFVWAFSLLLGAMYITVVQRVLSRERTWTVLSGFCALMAGALHDLGMVLGAVAPDHWSYITPGFTVMLLCYTVAASRYLVQNLEKAEQSNEVLEAVIADKTAALEASYRQLREHDQESARSQEREHLLREMHDGMGAQLMTALRGVERGTLPREQVLQALQDSLDNLRLLMDSTDMGRELHGALVTWRSRWAPRLSALDLALDWQLDDKLETVAIAPDTVLQLMRILQEAVVNVVKHAGATQLRVHTIRIDGTDGAHGNTTVRVTVLDNGCGLPVDQPPRRGGRGLANMATRAQQVGAQLQVTNATGPWHGTEVRITLALPDSAHQAPAGSLHGRLGAG